MFNYIGGYRKRDFLKGIHSLSYICLFFIFFYYFFFNISERKDLPYEEKRKIQGKFFSFSSFAAAFVVLFISVREKERERERMNGCL